MVYSVCITFTRIFLLLIIFKELLWGAKIGNFDNAESHSLLSKENERQALTFLPAELAHDISSKSANFFQSAIL
jgi:hypothetical protein